MVEHVVTAVDVNDIRADVRLTARFGH